MSSLVLALAVCGALLGLPSAALAGAISGTVTAANGGAPIGGVQVCPTPQPSTFEAACTETNSSGAYELTSLRAGAYSLRFSGDRNNLPYVNEFYNDKESSPGDLVAIGDDVALGGVNAQLRDGGTIAGTVTDASSHAAVANFPVCAFAQVPTGEVGRCSRTDGSGNYAIKGLPSEEYEVAFEGEGGFNYLTQYWQASETYGDFDPVVVTEPETVSGISAELHPGVEIAGTLTEVGTRKPLANVSVSLLEPSTEKVLKYLSTDAAGHYAFRGRPAGSYVVGFSHTMFGPWNGDCYSAQYYKGSASFAGATPLTVAPPQVLTGIDGEVANLFCPQPPLPQPVKVTLLPFTPEEPPLPPRKCGKGKKKKLVKGKLRCVKKPKKRHHKRGGHGPHAVATER